MDTSPTALFDSYEQDFQQFIESIRDKLEGSGKDEVGEQRRATLRRVEMDIDEADEMVSQMEIEIQGIPQSLRTSYLSRLKSAKTSLTTYKKSLTDVRATLARTELLSSSSKSPSPGLGGEYPNTDDPYTSDRSRLLAGTNILEDGTKRLQESQRIALETEEQGADILTNLRGQREQIENARNTLWRADTAIDRASGTVKKMIRRMYQQRAVTYAIITVLILLIVIIIWEKLSG
ncbi:V-snare-domain-containing protein [Macrolepiota fuliginosa MF-IS2]|uniref:V-snare-domain-containing protein n=1 Tax=Macrolepiota fuliginosa MF-IS2 TaxID=1400762 RepID=A0A9P5XKB3_9AGAR|nr:V-snare-domain-containing protein [Macrolepiota fuliginosa MF-IS2]